MQSIVTRLILKSFKRYRCDNQLSYVCNRLSLEFFWKMHYFSTPLRQTFSWYPFHINALTFLVILATIAMIYEWLFHHYKYNSNFHFTLTSFKNYSKFSLHNIHNRIFILRYFMNHIFISYSSKYHWALKEYLFFNLHIWRRRILYSFGQVLTIL